MTRAIADIPAKPFCPCDLNQPQDCKPEEWTEAHQLRICRVCGCPSYQHTQQTASDGPDDAEATYWCPARQYWGWKWCPDPSSQEQQT